MTPLAGDAVALIMLPIMPPAPQPVTRADLAPVAGHQAQAVGGRLETAATLTSIRNVLSENTMDLTLRHIPGFFVRNLPIHLSLFAIQMQKSC